jgi:L-threonylcarbamoyladenylate synthase
VKVLPPSPEAYAEAAEVLRAGGVVAYPTETVYGLAVDPHNADALARLFEVKGRPDTNPVLLIVDSPSQLDAIALPLSPRAQRCADTFWPGPLSLVLGAIPGLPAPIAPAGKVCVRCPGSHVARAICAAFGGAITSTSANLSGEPAATDATAASLAGVSLVIDGGTLPPSAPSTVYDPDTGTVFRAGAISAEALAALH